MIDLETENRENDNSDVAKDEGGEINIVKEAMLLFRIAGPTILVQISAYFIYPQAASAVGRLLGTEALAAISLASLTGNILCLSVVMGVLSAADILLPRAYGMKNYREVAVLTVRSAVVCTVALVLPILLLLLCADSIYQALGQDPEVSRMASSWLRVYVLCVPMLALFPLLQRFLSCQNIVWPLVYGSALGCFLVQPFLLRWFVPRYGLAGSAYALLVTGASQVLIVLLYLRIWKDYNEHTWPGWSVSLWEEAVAVGPTMVFAKLGLGGILSMSEWWFWEAVCFLAGSLGVIDLSIHSIAYNLFPFSFMVPLGITIGMSVRIGQTLGTDVRKAQLLAGYSVLLTVVVAAVWSSGVYWLQTPIVSFFTTDPAVLAGCRRIWPHMCVSLCLDFLFCVNSGILRALGMQTELSLWICGVLWGVAFPMMVWQMHHRQQQDEGLRVIWQIFPVAYAVLNAGFVAMYVTADWEGISREIRKEKNGKTKVEAQETTRLLERSEERKV